MAEGLALSVGVVLLAVSLAAEVADVADVAVEDALEQESADCAPAARATTGAVRKVVWNDTRVSSAA